MFKVSVEITDEKNENGKSNLPIMVTADKMRAALKKALVLKKLSKKSDKFLRKQQEERSKILACCCSRQLWERGGN